MLANAEQALAFLRARVGARLRADSRQVAPGDGFLAWASAPEAAWAHASDALARGAEACVLDAAALVPDAQADAPQLARLPGLKAKTGAIASAWLGEPSAQMRVLAVTGTNGKTSTAWWLAQAIEKLAKKELAALGGCGFVGTLGAGSLGRLASTGMTTPDPVVLQQALADLLGAGRRACAIEASSIGIAEQRLAATRIDTAIFTNFTQDHLDYHGSMAAYWQAKRALFDWPGLRAAVVNVDDAQGVRLHAELAPRALDLWSVAVAAPARLRAENLCHGPEGLVFDVVEGNQRASLATRLVGDYNAANLLGVIATLRSLGVPLAAACGACADLAPVPGRMQQVALAGQPLAVVDYAHTPDALTQALAALRPLARQRGGRLWCVFGCGGDRDAGKRPLMGEAAQAGAERCVLTSDNPRSEAPQAIIAQVRAGMGAAADAVQVEVDRAQAIAQALAQADARDVVLIAGKGHEDYQETAGVRRPFSDAEHARAALQRRAGTLGPMCTLAQAHALLQARVPAARLVGDGATPLLRVHSDSRSLQPGDLFVALKGERFDAHEFLPQARAAGAAAALAEHGLEAAGLAGISVPDSLQALGALATAWRAQHALALVAVTGSNGKTTVTQMVAAILRAWLGDAALATRGNLNNAIGVPLTLMGLRPAHRAAVVELGMNHPGEIAALAAMAQPTVALVNNAQREHLEFMHSVQAVAHENGAVLRALSADGVAVFPHADEYSALWRELAGQRRVLTFGDDAAADVHCARAQWQGDAWQLTLRTPAGELQTRLAIAGRHNLLNALAAAACALAAGAPLQALAQGLAQFRAVTGRSRAFALQRGAHRLSVVDDSYNANPDSVRAAIEVLASLPAPRLLVLGDMGEVGSQGPQFHAEAGSYARAQGVERLLVLGALSGHAAQAFGAGAECFDDAAALIARVLECLPQTASVLVKGSRFMRMERVVQAIEEGGA
ncbi:bifunctional UDP-N-acetylmuramoyl-L-alanyl-D-glutamate--2,6-diaminopimelate ligase MurE/UDP-N-acetylmuramoyl-tripeptide--D-alanyl-D-alanine ligase MurF [Comamonas sp. NLF-1-9]|uniref:bifunctional UDP-N-acetylmuramoyl-L-alanyl-D-glutamate--2, 6-diaminopimelate ligase MurE/UDP-N-acetylmuramoyl-tripeptide--D-alanyl-D-alanine ligase MurF n=1 Tax=Comamonas sp. NLF-1-9 TaxID=2853163 RepID=UPI001C475BC5|nr:bifunctional UDP-N-acetylmuramoyl-L-alanyl-D-glutamate--2,6-diaminopimelate ligase MurE/UDP-N-acetylmuramoyl-tripeptide--D-alanyl-D-alanine ligase MurF [Comamonas sp. NLF-1-9]QXL83468.1 bifunctional UDP-N-acetylmuramoyl-L-alanyl-D-glutamate--2,6-diaminopimelate ligase MurE/UDP-N-acetylmuramoyl-tripeptide--D-alanyl-D-alanine ligase MurF [Comamonas sp. NLF-1-9]